MLPGVRVRLTEIMDQNMFVRWQSNTTVEVWWQLVSPLDRTVTGHWNNSCSVETNKWTRCNEDNVSTCMKYFHSLCNGQQTCTKRRTAIEPQVAKPLTTEMTVTEQRIELNFNDTSPMKKQYQPLCSKLVMFTTLQWITQLPFYIMTQSALFIPPTRHVRFHLSGRRHAGKLCCGAFFTHPVILLARNSISMLRRERLRLVEAGRL